MFGKGVDSSLGAVWEYFAANLRSLVLHGALPLAC